MKVIKNILKNMIMISVIVLFITTPVFADVAIPMMNPVEEFLFDFFNGDEKVFVVGMIILAVIIAVICGIAISKQESKEEDVTKNK